MNKDEKFIKNWEKTRARGRLRYALFEGTLFGLLIMFVQIIASALSKAVENYFAQNYVLVIFIHILGGILIYWLVFWPMNEYFYRKKKLKINQKNDSK